MIDSHFLGPSGQWLKDIPARWDIAPLWSMFDRIKDVGHPDEMMLSVFRDYGVVPKESRENLNKTAENRNIYQLVHPGWLVVNRMKAWQGSVGISDYRGIVSGHYVCFAPTHQEDSRYLNYALRSDAYRAIYQGLSRGVRPGQIEIDNDQLRKLPIPRPPLEEQQRIADYLNREIGQINALISAQERFIVRLQERRQAVVERELAGITPTAPGTRLKHLVLSVRQGWSPQCLPWPGDGSRTWAVLKAGAANRGVFRPEENKQLPEDLEPRPSTVVRRGELLISRANTRDLVGSAAVISGNYPRLMLSDKLYALTLDESKALPPYVAHLMASRRVRDLIEMDATGASSSMLNISRNEILNLPMEVPEIAEQRRILDQVERETAKIDILITKTQRHIDLVKERRSTLVTAAVTGQIDILKEA